MLISIFINRSCLLNTSIKSSRFLSMYLESILIFLFKNMSSLVMTTVAVLYLLSVSHSYFIISAVLNCNVIGKGTWSKLVIVIIFFLFPSI
jgi:hypothetical protein